MPGYLEKKLGYKIIEKTELYHVYQVGKDEDKAMEEFEKYNEFISEIDKRDLRFEKRNEFHENLELLSKELNTELPKKEFLEELNNIKNYIEGFDDSMID